MGVVLASKGYPGHYEKGFPMELPAEAPGIRVYHMGTALRDGGFVTAGGRVIMPVARAASLPEARERVYAAAARITCDNLFYRHDIAHQAE